MRDWVISMFERGGGGGHGDAAATAGSSNANSQRIQHRKINRRSHACSDDGG